jgi:hypothetical protein
MRDKFVIKLQVINYFITLKHFSILSEKITTKYTVFPIAVLQEKYNDTSTHKIILSFTSYVCEKQYLILTDHKLQAFENKAL